MWPFGKKKKRNKDGTQKISYQTIEEKTGDLAQHYVVDLCEQIIDASRELDDARLEYNMVTEYLNDVQTIEDLPKEKKNQLTEYATYVAKLNQERSTLLQSESKLSDTQFAQMQEEEDEIPAVVKRLRANEDYLDAIEKDLHTLEGEKLSWNLLRQECYRDQKILRILSVTAMTIFGVVLISFLVAYFVWNMDMQLPILIAAFLATLVGVLIFVKYQDNQKEIKRCDVNRDHAITLENHVKIKYVNMKNAVDYTCEKYHVNHSSELSCIYEEYQAMVKQRERFRITNEDLEYYTRQLIDCLSKLHLYDAKIWMNYANAFLDKKEMVEVKHNLIVRRQKLRSRMEYNLQVISSLREEIKKYEGQLGESAAQIDKILRKIDELNKG